MFVILLLYAVITHFCKWYWCLHIFDGYTASVLQLFTLKKRRWSFRTITAISFMDRSALLRFVNEQIGCGVWFETFTALSD
jgi:hypothetical protein